MLFKWLSNVLDSVGPILSLFYVVYYGVDFVLVLTIHSIPYVNPIQVNLKMCPNKTDRHDITEILLKVYYANVNINLNKM
jgi:hypothetical protein